MKRFLLLVWAFAALPAFAQQNISGGGFGYWQDVIQYSDIYSSGSARMNAIQNAQVGLGGDISNAATNPAGLGMLRRSEFSFSPALISTNTSNTTQYQNPKTGVFQSNTTTGSGSNFHIGQMGVVIANPVSETRPGGFRGGSFAFTLSRINQFNNYRTFNSGPMEGTADRPNSYVDYFLAAAGAGYQNVSPSQTANIFYTSDYLNNNSSLDQNQFDARNAYAHYLIEYAYDSANNRGSFYSNIPSGIVRQSGRILNKGYQNQFDAAYGFNLNDRLYLGGGIGIPYVSATQQVFYQEKLLATYATNPQALQYQGFYFDRSELLTTTGIGFNAKLGGIYKVANFLRIGISLQSPTWYSLSTDQSYNLLPHFINDQGKAIDYDSSKFTPTFPNGAQTYRINRTSYSMRTPATFSGGFSLLSEKLGFLSVQGTMIPYSMARLGGTTYSDDNAYLSAHTRLVSQIRVGGELKVGPLGRLRGGVAWLQNPVIGARDSWSYSFGGGLKFSDWYIDASANVFQRRQSYYVYSYSPVLNTIANNVNVQFTVGSYF